VARGVKLKTVSHQLSAKNKSWPLMV